MSHSDTVVPTLEERELELALREEELNRREAALAQSEQDDRAAHAIDEIELDLAERLALVERRERELLQTVEAVDAQRQRLEDVRLEYETRRDGLAERVREVEEERDRLREERARLVSERIGRGRPPLPLPPVSPTVEPASPAPDAFKEPVKRSPIDEWWSKQLGSPLEAA